jgi:MoaA/NifB/PqqE/SkfB family radical SAM enzyme/glycosyltransferase involved in cell wall biosynthesis
MPSLNQVDFIEQAIHSVLNQPYTKIELIVADGLSTDGTLSVLQTIQEQDSRLKWFSEKDSGPANAINKALSQIRGSIIGWLNSDDLYTQDAITRAINVLQDDNKVMVYGQGEHIDVNGKTIDLYPTLTPDVPLKQFSNGCFICQPTVFFNRTVFLLLGKLDETLKTAFDFDYWFRVFTQFSGRIGFVDKVQAQSRLHEDCITHKMRRTVALEGMQVIAKYLGYSPVHWMLTYRDELLNQSPETWEFDNLRKHIETFIDEGADYLTKDEATQLKNNFAKDTRLDKRKLIDPKHNHELAMQEFKQGVVKVQSTPSMLTLETTSRCNLRCVMCPQAINAVDRPRDLDDYLVERMNFFIGQAKSVQLHGIGEPLLSSAFWSTIQHLPSRDKCESSINTNLTQLEEHRLQNLLDSPLKVINISLDAAKPETYKKIRGFDFDKVIKNIKNLIKAREKKKQAYPLVYMNMTLMRSNIEEVSGLIELAAKLGTDMVCLWHLNHWSEEEMKRYIIKREDWLFDYAKEGLWNYPDLSNKYLHKAEKTASEMSIKLHLDGNKTVYFEDTHK